MKWLRFLLFPVLLALFVAACWGYGLYLLREPDDPPPFDRAHAPEISLDPAPPLPLTPADRPAISLAAAPAPRALAASAGPSSLGDPQHEPDSAVLTDKLPEGLPVAGERVDALRARTLFHRHRSLVHTWSSRGDVRRRAGSRPDRNADPPRSRAARASHQTPTPQVADGGAPGARDREGVRRFFVDADFSDERETYRQ